MMHFMSGKREVKVFQSGNTYEVFADGKFLASIVLKPDTYHHVFFKKFKTLQRAVDYVLAQA